MIDKMKKSYQKKLTKLIKEANEAIAKDDLWKGRVELRQIYSRWEKFSDGSGGILHVVIRCIDKKTKQYKDYVFEYAPWISTIYWHISMDILNDFFVEALDVWRNENPRDEVFDWTKTPISSEALKNTKLSDISISLYQLCKY